MKFDARYVMLCFSLAALAAPLPCPAATVWTGPVVTFTNLAGSDPTQATNQDRLTPNVWITRGSSAGIYNAKTETGFTHFQSPLDTEWADRTSTNYTSLRYTNWNSWVKVTHTGPASTVGVDAVVHLISDDIYVDVQFLSWGGIGGGFAWQHTTPAASNGFLLTATLSGAGLDLSWPTTGIRLQSQVGALGTNWVDVPNSTTTNQMVIPINPARTSVFYRLAN